MSAGRGADRPLSVLRLCSVFEPAETDADQVEAQAAFDPIGGMQNHTANLTRALDAQGVRQTVITSRPCGGTSDTAFGRFGRVVRVGWPTTRLRQLWALGAVRQILRARRVDVVHAHQGEDLAALPLGILAARRFGCPLVVTLHCSVAHTVPAAGVKLTAMRTFGGPLETACLHRAASIIALVQATADRLGPLGSRTVVIPSGVEPERFRVPPSTLFDDVPRPVVLYLGRLARQKDVPTLVRAFGRLRTPASLVVIGDGPDHTGVDTAVANLPVDVRNRVHRLGFRPHTEVPGLLAAADLIVLPSIYEEMGSILAEALQAGRPVVATRVGGIPSVVQDGRTGLLVPPSDPAAMAAAIDRLLGDPALLAEMGEQSLVAAADYDWTTLGKSVRDVYDAALADAACSAASRSASR